MNVSINYLRSMQDKATGCFRTEGRVAHKAMEVRIIYADQNIVAYYKLYPTSKVGQDPTA